MAQDDAGASDTRLTELLSADTPSAYPALQELRERHRPSVLAYARLCTRSGVGRAAARGAGVHAGGPGDGARLEPERPLAPPAPAAGGAGGRLLGEGRTGRGPRPRSAPRAERGRPRRARAAHARPFRSLPSRTQGLLWYGVVEKEPADRAAVLLGLTREDVTYGAQPALHALGQACLKARLAASDDPRCGDFRRLIEEALRPDNPRSSPDLHAHMAHCAHCTTAYEELSALRDHPRTALAEGLLPWSGTAYVMSEAGEPRPGVPPRRGPGRRPAVSSSPRRRPRRRPGAAAVRRAVVGRLAVPEHGGLGHRPSSVPQVTCDGDRLGDPRPRPRCRPRPARPLPRRGALPSRSASPTPSPTPTPAHPPGSDYAQVVNLASGLCLDIRDGDLTQGTDVVTAPCTSARTQRWRVDSGRGVLQSYADSDFCLDSRGSVDNGVGIWDCGSIDGSHGQNLRFTVDDDGVIRPAIAVETAVTPSGGDGVSLLPLDGSTGQRWRAGPRDPGVLTGAS
ncbi:RICIN domain-containing protein [Streptomyces mirabilis]|nr:RICIN domain-containing protein [Streptomyces mirabilis]